MTRQVLITHPGRQHSHQAALALQAAGRLAGYWAGVPSVEAHLARLPGRWLRPFVRYSSVPLEERLARWQPIPPILRRLSGALLPRRAAHRVDFLACRLFDRWVARRLGDVAADGVIACEISALDTFRRAKRAGLTTFLDAPSFHHEAQDRLHGFDEPAGLHQRIVAVKDAEIELADHVLTVSELARQTYVEAGVPPERVHAVPLGADLDLFTPETAGKGDRDPVTFLFAGASIHRKGFDLLVEAFERVHREIPTVALRIAGPPGTEARLLDRLDASSVTDLGPVPQEELASELRRADCLVLPSRNDSFGMVVAETLACGTPAIVSEMVGAKELVEEGRSGWIVAAGSVDALADRMLRCARDPRGLRALRPAARQAAEQATWEAYHRRFAALLAELLEDARTGNPSR